LKAISFKQQAKEKLQLAGAKLDEASKGLSIEDGAFEYMRRAATLLAGCVAHLNWTAGCFIVASKVAVDIEYIIAMNEQRQAVALGLTENRLNLLASAADEVTAAASFFERQMNGDAESGIPSA